MEKYFQVGDVVFSQTFGKGIVTSIEEKAIYPLTVRFEGYISFTIDGRYDYKYPIGLSKVPLPEIVNKPIEEFTLSFHEAMVELFGNGKEVSCESKQGFTFHTDTEGEILSVYESTIYSGIFINQEMYESKWRVW